VYKQLTPHTNRKVGARHRFQSIGCGLSG
jgi:hypothetical protein